MQAMRTLLLVLIALTLIGCGGEGVNSVGPDGNGTATTGGH